jgi:putative transposase
MPWMEVSAMNAKVSFVSDFLNQRFFTVSELCNRYGIARKTGYQLVDRYLEEGVDGLKERSRRPHFCPHKTPENVEQVLVALRKKYPAKGAKKLVKPFKRLHPSWALPSEATISNIISRNGLIVERRRRPRHSHPGRPISVPQAPNQLWGGDYKGEFKMGNGDYCWPLTISDIYSRQILCCTGLLSPNLKETMSLFAKTFRKYGLPERIRTDNGTPFAASTSLGRISNLSAWWIRLGILPELIEPASPAQNGIHERMHRTLKAEILRKPAHSLGAQQKVFDDFVQDFNYERTHEALGQETPASVYKHSQREMPTKLPPIEYPSHFETRRVSRNGGIRWHHDWVNASQILAEEYIAFEQFDDGLYHVYFSFVQIGRFDERKGKIETDRSNARMHFGVY